MFMVILHKFLLHLFMFITLKSNENEDVENVSFILFRHRSPTKWRNLDLWADRFYNLTIYIPTFEDRHSVSKEVRPFYIDRRYDPSHTRRFSVKEITVGWLKDLLLERWVLFQKVRSELTDLYPRQRTEKMEP